MEWWAKYNVIETEEYVYGDVQDFGDGIEEVSAETSGYEDDEIKKPEDEENK